jgi:NAD(P)-dependent dehydrogenase (short-subunit alcohol dehydrogenase family)
MVELAGAGVVVSGGASGLGEATVRELAAAGGEVTILDLNVELGEEIARAIGGRFVRCDVTDEDDVKAAVSTAAERAPLRVAVNCAGIGPAARVVARDGSPHSLDLYRTVIDVNQVGTFNLLRIAAAAIAQSEPVDDGERGVIVNTASIAAFDGQVGQIAYSASKGAIVGMTLPAARDLASLGIRVCTIAPGLFETPLLGGLPEAAREGLAEDVVFPKRLGRPRDFAHLVKAIVENPYLNGETIRLDGALRMQPR